MARGHEHWYPVLGVGGVTKGEEGAGAWIWPFSNSSTVPGHIWTWQHCTEKNTLVSSPEAQPPNGMMES
jgi:hypothetical protein